MPRVAARSRRRRSLAAVLGDAGAGEGAGPKVRIMARRLRASIDAAARAVRAGDTCELLPTITALAEDAGALQTLLAIHGGTSAETALLTEASRLLHESRAPYCRGRPY